MLPTKCWKHSPRISWGPFFLLQKNQKTPQIGTLKFALRRSTPGAAGPGAPGFDPGAAGISAIPGFDPGAAGISAIPGFDFGPWTLDFGPFLIYERS